MDADNGEEPSPVAGVLSLGSASQQPYISELLSFTLDRLHKVGIISIAHACVNFSVASIL